ncbi:N-acyl homoserine lactonase family protein [Azospirillum sp. SYSU D00513]|uniref:N-acyl homoserine lactonase family protein n=1 Tax=Azospirillum sp. SYSU D00513 TaxID=2812561 RepID=UPI001A96B012|nr:N-acyl homoserine lactonase family protein [Azospirillum sp. SYSU D00513]
MSLKIHPINLGNITMDASGLVLFRGPGMTTTIPTLGFLITGGEGPVLVDTGPRNVQQYAEFGFLGEQTPEMTIEHHLARHGLRMGDLRYVVNTHAHIDHAGGNDRFPLSVPIAIARREMQAAASGVMGSAMYTAADTKHLIDRLHTRGALRLFDVDGSFEEEVIPGVAVRLTGGHTDGSISVLVETDEGIANICGDIVYDLKDQLITPHLDRNHMEPTVTANRSTTILAEKTAIKRALAGSRFLLPSHDVPALVSGGRVVGLLENAISNPAADVTAAAGYAPLADTRKAAA